MSTAAELLLATARRGGIHHSIILQGSSPDALRALAISVARALNCFNGTSGDSCIACQKIDRGIHPDVHLVSVSDERKLISAEQVRGVVTGASLRPYEGRSKVFILDPADATSITAANALLKTLEEPASDTVFLLLTRSSDLLLPTIRSRSQIVRIDESSVDDSDAGPRQRSRLRREARASGTDPRHAEALATSLIDSLDRYASQKETAALLFAAAAVASADDERQSIAIYAGVLRDLAALDPAESLDPVKAARIQGAIPRERMLAAADLAVRALGRLVVNADARMLVEQSVAALARKN
jgi:DNA polymerase III delta prime subunit